LWESVIDEPQGAYHHNETNRQDPRGKKPGLQRGLADELETAVEITRKRHGDGRRQNRSTCGSHVARLSLGGR